MKTIFAAAVAVVIFLFILAMPKEEPKPVDVPYPQFDSVLVQNYCNAVADMKLSKSWDEKCGKIGKEYHCALSDSDARLQFDGWRRTVSECETRIVK